MKNFIKFGIVAALLASAAACAKVPAGYVGVKVYQLGGSKGVDTEELGVGQYLLGMNEELYLFPVFMQNYTWAKTPAGDESITFQTADGMRINADVGISYRIAPDKVSTIFQTYRRGIEEITDTFLHNMVRDAFVEIASDKPVDYVYGAGKAQLIEQVQKHVQAQVADIGIQIDKVYWVGEIRLPDNVVQSINAKIAATQMAQQRQNEVAQAKAEADKSIEVARGSATAITIQAEAQAKANKILSESLTPELVQYRAIDKWDGVLPRFGGTGPVPFLDVTNQNQ